MLAAESASNSDSQNTLWPTNMAARENKTKRKRWQSRSRSPDYWLHSPGEVQDYKPHPLQATSTRSTVRVKEIDKIHARIFEWA